jgi:hypothetical protein
VEALPSEAYDGVLARAFATPVVTLEHAARIVRPGGAALLFLTETTDSPQHPGFEVFHVEHYTVGGKARKTVALTRRGSDG